MFAGWLQNISQLFLNGNYVEIILEKIFIELIANVVILL